MQALKSLALKVLPAGAELHLRAFDHYLNGEAELRLLPRLVPKGKRAVDAGANIGTYSYFMRRTASQVVAYEPNPGLASRLLGLMPNVRVRNVALSDQSGHLVLQVPVDEQGRLHHELGSVGQGFDGETRDFKVDCIKLDADELKDVGFIKVDVEQHERQVLRGAMQTIRNNRPVMLIEVYPLKYQDPVPKEFSFITDEGFEGWFVYGGKWLPFKDFQPDVHAKAELFGDEMKFMGNNVIFFPKEHPLAQKGPLG